MKLNMKILIILVLSPYFIYILCICGLLASAFLSNDNELSVESQRELDDDREHAEADARKYLEDKYHMDFEMNSFEPDIYMLSSDFKTYYDRIWIGEFTVDGKQYEIQGRVPDFFLDSIISFTFPIVTTNEFKFYLLEFYQIF